ncbi:MAG: oligosaccharide flippase family protein [Candidatus Bathyarchaeia archaeon]
MTTEIINLAEDSAKSGFFLATGTAISTAIMSIAAILIGRLLGPESYAKYTLAFVIPHILFLFTDLGITQGITKFSASLNNRGETKRLMEIIQTAILFRILVGAFIFTINFTLADHFASFLNRPEISPYIRAASTAIIFQVLFTSVESAFVGLDKTEYTALATNINAFIKVAVTISLLLIGLGVTGAILGYVVGYAVAGAIGIFILFFRVLKKFIKINKGSFYQNLKILMHYGAPLYVSTLITGFLPLCQNFLLTLFTTDRDIGNFKASTNFIALISIFSIAVTTALLPGFSKLDSDSKEKIKTFFKLSTKYASLLVVPTATFILIFSNKIVQIVYGSEFQSASTFLSLSCMVYYLVALGYLILPSLFNGLEATKDTLRMAIINFSLFLALSPILTKIYNVPGLIASSLISNFVATLYAKHIAQTRFGVEFDTTSITRIYLVAAISAFFSLLTNYMTSSEIFGLILGGTIYFLVYITLMPLTKVIEKNELKNISNVTRKIKVIGPLADPILKYQQKILKIKSGMMKRT